MRRHTIAAALALLLYGTLAAAQTTQTLTYDYLVAPSEVSTYAQTIKVDGTVVAAAPTCAQSAPNVTTCSVTIPSLAVGTHTIDITAVRSGMSAETITAGLNPANGPKNPSNIRVGVVVTITVQ